ncbi:MAG: putative transport system permease protein [Streptosporangiaceae bacterium]|nr:putative transport system permease protein [Streptosporangiaceae bacterium]
MIKLTLRELTVRKRRLLGSFLAVFLGVAFLAGTLVLADTLQSGIKGFLTHAYAGTDVSVRNATSVSDAPGSIRGMIDGSIADQVRRVDGVAAAESVIQGSGQLLDTGGKLINVLGPRTAGNWINDPALNPYTIAEGRPPRGPGEVVIDRKVARDGHLRLGDHTVVLTPQRVPVTIVGIARFGAEDAFGGTSFTAFTLQDARRDVAQNPGRITSVSIRAAPGVSQDALAARIRPLLPQGVEATTGKRLADESMSTINSSFLGFVRAFLLVFAAVALLVGTFSIHNTFSIVVAQRTRDAALLRALGASRRQILLSVVVEALAVGLTASLAGALGGFGFAALLKALFAGFGFGLKATGVVFSVTPLLIAVPVGVLVTLAACLTPALRASRVPPLAALREVAVERSGAAPSRTITGSALAALGTGLLLWSALTQTLPVGGLGAVIGLIAMVVLGPVAARPVASLAGAPAVRLRGAAGGLARQNAMRSPRRTAGAATALMIGVGVVTLFTVFAASLKTTTAGQIERSFGGDLVVSAGGNGSAGFGPGLATGVSALPEVAGAAAMGSGDVQIDGSGKTVRVADPGRLAGVVRLKVRSGSLTGLGTDRIAVSSSVGKPVGAPLRVRFADGSAQTFTVGAVYAPLDTVGSYVMPRAAWATHDPQGLDSVIFVDLRPGIAPATGKAAVAAVARSYGTPSVQTRAEYTDAQTAPLDNLLAVVYVMLALAIIIALMGIANTLSLAVHERTREIGLLRAVGATRGQIRTMIRWESLIVALFGTAGGLGLGLFLGWALVAAGAESFAGPVVQIVVITAVGALAGALAAIRPARRAARLRIIEAISAA